MVVLNPGDESWGNDGFWPWPRYRAYPSGMVKGVSSDFNRINRDSACPCAKVCNLCPLPAKAHSYTLATERHNVF
jgi:hypothetical protein